MKEKTTKNLLLSILILGLLLFSACGETSQRSPVSEPSKEATTQEETAETEQSKEEKTDVEPQAEKPKPEAETQPKAEEPKERTYLVTRVVDGDTIVIEGGQKVRYIGIDTPESVHPSKPVECFGKEASNKNKELVEGKRVRLEKDVSDTDRYGRLLRYIWVSDIFVNDYLVRHGYAYAFTYPPDVKYSEQFVQAQKEARENNRGLWGACQKESPEAKAQPTSQEPQSAPQTAHIFYLSTYRTAKYYYCDTDNGWKSLSKKYLKSYPSEEALLKDYPNRILHESCK